MKIQKEKKFRIPYASPGLAGQAIDIFRRMTPQKITSKFIVDNDLSTFPNAFKIMDLLMWFGIIDREGQVNNEIAQKLKLVGKDKEDFMKNLIIKSYAELFNSLDLKQVSRNDIQNFIINHYEFGQAQAKYATILFLNFCQIYGIEMADELKKKMYKFSERKRIKRPERKTSSNIQKDKKNVYEYNTQTDEIAIIIKGPNINYPFYAKNREDFEEIVEKKLPIAIEGVRNSLKLLELEKKEDKEGKNEE